MPMSVRYGVNDSDDISINTLYLSPRAIDCISVSTDILWDGVEIEGKTDLVFNAMKIMAEDIERIFYVKARGSNRIPLCRLRSQCQPVPFHSLGDGVSRLFEIILSVVRLSGGICLIDEFENGLHWSVQEKIWNVIFKTAQTLNVQIFATTHSKDTVETFQKVALQYERQKSGF
ncbi:MAG: ATP-binding protein, partial [Planctomycetaceae bacterium]|nr:ATP-binding protein [Planctomycetaceae bacterium]